MLGACRVEYFGVKLEGFAFTENGWVQSYGSRYVRPPIIYGDVSRTGPITVKEFKYAQSLTKKPVKGMLTGEQPLSPPHHSQLLLSFKAGQIFLADCRLLRVHLGCWKSHHLK